MSAGEKAPCSNLPASAGASAIGRHQSVGNPIGRLALVCHAGAARMAISFSATGAELVSYAAECDPQRGREGTTFCPNRWMWMQSRSGSLLDPNPDISSFISRQLSVTMSRQNRAPSPGCFIPKFSLCYEPSSQMMNDHEYGSQNVNPKRLKRWGRNTNCGFLPFLAKPNLLIPLISGAEINPYSLFEEGFLKATHQEE